MCALRGVSSVPPYPAYGEIVQLDVLNDFIQQPVRHGVEIRKRVGLQGDGREKLGRQPPKAVSQNGTGHFSNLLPSANVPGSSPTSGSRVSTPAVPAQ